MRFIHDFDLMSTLTSEHEDFHEVPAIEIVTALQERLDYLKANLSEVHEAFGSVNTSEELE